MIQNKQVLFWEHKGGLATIAVAVPSFLHRKKMALDKGRRAHAWPSLVKRCLVSWTANASNSRLAQVLRLIQDFHGSKEGSGIHEGALRCQLPKIPSTMVHHGSY